MNRLNIFGRLNKLSSRGSGFSWSSYWAANPPTNLAVVWVDDYASLTWDIGGTRGAYEIWESLNGGAYSLVATTAEGAVSYNNYTYQNASMIFKIRGVGGGVYSEFTDPTDALATPLVFKTDQSTLTDVVFATLYVAAGKTVNVNWGDGTNADYSGDTTNITKSYSVEGQYFIKFSGDTNSIFDLGHYNQAKSYGLLTKWILPRPGTSMKLKIYNNNFTGDCSDWILDPYMTSFYIFNNNFTGILPNIASSIAGGLQYSAYGNYFTGSNITVFKPGMTVFDIKNQNALFVTSEVNTLLKAIADYYEDNTPTAATCTFTMTGNNIGAPTGGSLNVDIVRTKGYFTNAGKTAVFNVNDPVPFDNAKLVLTTDGNYLSLYTQYYASLISKGVVGTFYTWTDNVGEAGAYTWANLLTMLANDMDVQSHSKDHARFTDMDESTLRANYEAVNAAFVANGLPSPNHIAYPYGSNNAFVREISADYVLTGRNFDTDQNIQYKNLSKLDFGQIQIDDHNDVDFDMVAFEDILDEAVTNKGAVVTTSHKCHTTGLYEYPSTKKENLEAIIDLAVAKGMDIITISELYELLD